MKTKIVYVLSAACLVAVAVMIAALSMTGSGFGKQEFAPPPFEENACSGMPETSDESWMRIYRDGMSFSAHVCGNLVIKNGVANLYFTNDGVNNVWLKLRAVDESGNIIAETGLLKPDEYVKSVKFDIAVSSTALKLKIMAYEPNTYYSAGSVTITPKVTILP